MLLVIEARLAVGVDDFHRVALLHVIDKVVQLHRQMLVGGEDL
jgi:hypothetical protein